MKPRGAASWLPQSTHRSAIRALQPQGRSPHAFGVQGWASLALLALLAALGCGGGGAGAPPCERPVDPGAMSAARAAEIAPEVSQGLAFSVTWVRGDCRPKALTGVMTGGTTSVDGCGDGLCLRTRAPVEVAVLPSGVSVARSAVCGEGASREALRSVQVASAEASALGEVVFSLPPGGYRPYVVGSDGCAGCGDPGAGACVVRVEPATVTARDLVLDEAAH